MGLIRSSQYLLVSWLKYQLEILVSKSSFFFQKFPMGNKVLRADCNFSAAHNVLQKSLKLSQ